MEIHSYLFFMEQKQIYRYKYRAGDRFDLLTYSDNSKSKCFSSDSDFWKEWESASCYQPGDFVDFAFLSDQESWSIEIPEDYQVQNPTQFCTYQRIRDIFCKEVFKHPNIMLSFNGRDEQIFGRRTLNDDKMKELYLIIPYPTPDNKLPQKNDGNYTVGDYAAEKKRERQEKIDKLHKKKLKG